jgi:hypothetical protein
VAVTADGIVFVSDAPGAWRELARGEVLPNCVAQVGEQILIGGPEARLYTADEEGLRGVPGFDVVDGRDDWSTPWGGPPDVRSMSVSADGSAIYANVHVGGIPRSDDGGRSWRPTIDVGADVHQVLAHPTEPDVVLAASARGLEVSTDRGITWATHTDGLHASYARAVAVAGGTVLLSASTGPFSHQAAVYRAAFEPAEAVAFERCTDGLPEWFDGNVDTHCLAARGNEVAIGTEDGDVYLSDDAGRSWSRASDGLAAIRALAFS